MLEPQAKRILDFVRDLKKREAPEREIFDEGFKPSDPYALLLEIQDFISSLTE